MSEYQLSDLIDIAAMQRLMDHFYKATAIPVGIIDLDNNILVATGWQPICTKYHRQNPVTCARCHESDRFITRHLQDEDGYVEYKCLNGLWDVAVPIRINGKHLASLFVGQLFTMTRNRIARCS
ncbi:MAG: hypothetical protein COS82_10515 [Zetaproteobacteria bacterium CG06_land_8_20_14_3_00_59_53]|nr:MAG: hypothetical protein AUK36_02490 [Zetaproteobacteria bacterium CG2_30_59_37]PIO89530.1 MAG: hypothetical protein COX56_07965 [Zetaproteobacteria bacterium CG23_combo_of_CG06-09_8_20_14_all_59_86]PIQ65554.1 MAG: hypothetical protein COV97_04320 [Zetaproteobacteria bacterium CG11_big_fil_rev_8_21_14_0_20_59_439]PIU69807.1 MAG: hypothetical protein COS82_10515 [Zetaproteobacteria bacterium CG06_land_8_20_14_3_00_59_53]PIU97057.1 MAG: hypothetical protein COS62_06645 [Zetaproteobacteria bac